jgi:hypothetical protein
VPRLIASARRPARRCRSRVGTARGADRAVARPHRVPAVADARAGALIVSLALHFLLSGLGLLFFGPEARAQAAAGGALVVRASRCRADPPDDRVASC